MFDFYNTFYNVGYLDLAIVKEACKWKVITAEEYKTITQEDYVESTV